MNISTLIAVALVVTILLVADGVKADPDYTRVVCKNIAAVEISSCHPQDNYEVLRRIK